MCGVAGRLGPPLDQATTLAVQRALDHRGPDGAGARVWPDCTLIHTRLAIIDTSEAGTQPIASHSQAIWATVNGEIYNHHELRRSLEARGVRFIGNCDAEVVPNLYEQHGETFVEHLRGMFAAAVFDPSRGELTLTRDRCGIKPLYFAETKDGLAFASELNALRLLPGVDDRVDEQALHDFLALHYIPGPRTFFQGVRCLEPGQLLIASRHDGRLETRLSSYCNWTIEPEQHLELARATDEAERLLDAAVARQLESDVALGTMLSGGIDSAMVTAGAQKARTSPLSTYNVRFADRSYDETAAALAVSAHLHTDHRTLDLPDLSYSWERVSDVLLSTGQPYADSSILAVDALAALMREEVTVALSGDGGDEVFGGYESFRRIEPLARLLGVPPSARRTILRTLSALTSPLAGRGPIPASLSARLRVLARSGDHASMISGLACWLPDDELARWWRGGNVEPVSRLFERRWRHELPSGSSSVEGLSALLTETNARLRLPYDYLVKVDIASMRHGLEVRVPMLDEDLVSFGLRLSHGLKSSRSGRKRVLREVALRRLPTSVVGLPKHGFTVPVDRAVTADFRHEVQERLLDPRSPLTEFLEAREVERVVQSFLHGHRLPGVSRAGAYQRLIALLSLHLHLER